ncbi:alpha/beta-hydrolase [Xylariomycetidae sp. FL0641]|nr:alpha/beta-hydrolase [Xylariomycetidae sp. FL0641]
MEKKPSAAERSGPAPQAMRSFSRIAIALLILSSLALYHDLPGLSYQNLRSQYYDALTGGGKVPCHRKSPYGRFPVPDDPFHFMPCAYERTFPPALDDPQPERSWAELFDPNPDNWTWGGEEAEDESEGARRGGIYMCGYLDVPLDYTNTTEPRIVRLAVTKYQVSGLSRKDAGEHASNSTTPGSKSERTIVIEPGGPGGSGNLYVFKNAEYISKRLSDGKYDVLGWDPRGVNVTQPSIACFPYNADRDRWSLLANQYREVSESPNSQIEVADAMNEARFRACWNRHGDLGRFVSTAFVARDLEEIRKALGEDELTGYLVSYGTGIGQTYANMFPGSVGRMILDGTEYVRDHRLLGGFGWTALDNATDAWHDGFLGECLNAGPEHCHLARPKHNKPVTIDALEYRMESLLITIRNRPVPGYDESSGPSLVTYSALVEVIYAAMYSPAVWPALAHSLYDLEDGNSTLVTEMLNGRWDYDPSLPPPHMQRPSSEELGFLVICADSYDAVEPPAGLIWWQILWSNMTAQAWISGNSRFFDVFPCRHFNTFWPDVAEVYRGDLNNTLKNPVLLIAETYDPATPLRNGRRLLNEMGSNARLIAHHGYGHSSRDKSSCTDSIAKSYILHGELPDEQEVSCFADEKPYLYGPKAAKANDAVFEASEPVEVWREHLEELAYLNPRLLRH